MTQSTSFRRLAIPIVALVASVLPAAPATATVSAWPLGTVTPSSDPVLSCPAGSTCAAVEVVCPNSHPIVGFLSIAPATSPTAGLVVLYTGGGGTGWYVDLNPEFPGMVTRLQDQGIAVMQLHWRSSWWRTGSDFEAGIGELACRPASIAGYIYDTYYVPLGVDPAEPGRCGFCILGSSGGASAVAYTISHFGLDEILDAVIPVGGPPTAAFAKGCLRTPGEERYWYADSNAINFDESFGYLHQDGPCLLHDPAFAHRWIEQGNASGGSDYTHPTTRVHLITGERDNLVLTHSGDWIARLLEEGSPMVFQDVVPDTAHAVHGTPQGRVAIETSIVPEATVDLFTLTVTRAGVGRGIVNSSPTGIRCGTDCSELYSAGTSVTLTARVGQNSAFGGWSGACSGTGTCTVVMDGDRAVTATFVPA
jgi:Divergent InlB B-repeat domain